VAKKSSSRGKGKGKGKSKAGKDPITGRSLLLSQDGNTVEIRDDVIYEVWQGSPDTFSDDTFTPVRGTPTSRPPDGAYYGQYQLGDDRIVSATYGNYDEGVQYRSVALGDFSYDKHGRMTRSSVTNSGFTQVSDYDTGRVFGTLEEFSQPWISRIPYEGTPPPSTITANYSYNSTDPEEGGGLAAIRAFGGGKYFFEGWQNNLFDTSLV
jgi:hypothetical protein